MGNLAEIEAHVMPAAIKVGDEVFYSFRIGPGVVKALFAHSDGTACATVEWASGMLDSHAVADLELA